MFDDDFAGRVEQLIYVSVGRAEQEGRQTLPGETASKILHWFLSAPNFSQRKLHILTNQVYVIILHFFSGKIRWRSQHGLSRHWLDAGNGVSDKQLPKKMLRMGMSS